MTSDEIARFFNDTLAFNQGNPDLCNVIYVEYNIKNQDLFDKAFGYIRQYY